MASEGVVDLMTHSGSTYGVGYGVEREYRRYGAGVVGLVLFEPDGGLVPLILPHGYV